MANHLLKRINNLAKGRYSISTLLIIGILFPTFPASVLAAAPAVSSVSISSSTAKNDGVTPHTITMEANDSLGAANFSSVAVQLLNRANIFWKFASPFTSTKQPRTCTGPGGGFAGITDDTSGTETQYVDLVSCSSQVSGNNRTVNFVVRFKPSYTSPVQNSINAWAVNNLQEGSPLITGAPFTLQQDNAFTNSLLTEPDTEIIFQRARDAGFVVGTNISDDGMAFDIRDGAGKSILSGIQSPSFVFPMKVHIPLSVWTCEAVPGVNVNVINGVVDGIKNKINKIKFTRPSGITDGQYAKINSLISQAISSLNTDISSYTGSAGSPSIVPTFAMASPSDTTNVEFVGLPSRTPSFIQAMADYRVAGLAQTEYTYIHINLNAYTNTATTPTSDTELINITKHELAHALGLAHNEGATDLMARVNQDTAPILHLSTAEIEALIIAHDSSKTKSGNCRFGTNKNSVSNVPGAPLKNDYVLIPTYQFYYPSQVASVRPTDPVILNPVGFSDSLFPGKKGYYEACNTLPFSVPDPANPLVNNLWVFKAFVGYKLVPGKMPFTNSSIGFEINKTNYPCAIQLSSTTDLNISYPPSLVPNPTPGGDPDEVMPGDVKSAPANTILNPELLANAFYQPPTVNTPALTFAGNSTSSISPNGTQQYTISASATDERGAGNINEISAIINREGLNTGLFRGFITWHQSNPFNGSGKTPQTCAGGGVAAINPDLKYGATYVSLDSCSIITVGNKKTANFVLRFDPSFTGPASNTISTLASNDIGDLGWILGNTFTLANQSTDTTPPSSVVIVTPTDFNPYAGPSMPVEVTAVDNVAIANVQMWIDNVKIGEPMTTTPYKTTLDFSALEPESHFIFAIAKDAAGNQKQSMAVSIYLDKTKPVISTRPLFTNTPTITANSVVPRLFHLSARAVDETLMSSVQFKIDGNDVGPLFAIDPLNDPDLMNPVEIEPTLDFDASALTFGAHTVTVLATDFVGNTTLSAPTTFTIENPDHTPPTITITSPVNTSTVSGIVNVSAIATDDVGVSGVQFKIDGTNFGPEISAPYNLLWDTSNATRTSYTVTAVARDAAGNTTTSSPVTVSILQPDTTAPTVVILAPINNATLGATTNIVASASDNVGVASVQFKLDGNNLGTEDTTSPYSMAWKISTVPNGPHTLTAVAKDAAGNTTVSSTITVTVNNVTTPPPPPADTTAPTISISAPASGATVSGSLTTISTTVSDNVGVVGVQFKLDGTNLFTEDVTSPYSVLWNTTTVTNGSHTLTAVARDAAGNTKTSTPISVTVSNTTTPPPPPPPSPPPTDTTLPTVSITAPAASSTVSGSNVTLSATATDNVGVVGVQFKVDGANRGSEDTSSPYSKNWDTTTATNGTHTITAVARDAAGNTTTSTAVTVTVNNVTTPPLDTTAPTVSISAPSSGATISGSSTTVSATASDAVGVVGVQFKLDGTNLGTEDTSSPYSKTLDTTTLTNTSHTLTAVARDAAGNTKTSTPISVTVNNVATPPPSTTGILGNNVIQPDTDSSDSNSMDAVKFTMGSVGGTAQSMSVYISNPISSAPNNQFQVAIYTNDSGRPKNLVAKSASATIVGNAWNTVPITATLSANTTYWLAYNTNGTSTSVNNWKLGPGTSGQETWKDQTFGTWPSSFGGPKGTASKTASIYITYTTPSSFNDLPVENSAVAQVVEENNSNPLLAAVGSSMDTVGDAVIDVFDFFSSLLGF